MVKEQTAMATGTIAKRRTAPVAVGLSALAEGFGQAYNRQPAKAAVFLVAGLTLSTMCGLNTWLVRNVFGRKEARIGPERINPALLVAWTATYSVNLVDAWRNADRMSGEESTPT
jgi:hypothetical protein